MSSIDRLPLSTPEPLTTASLVSTTLSYGATMKPVELALNIGNSTHCERIELFWIKLVLLGAILVCLIILICSLCITSMCYFSSMSQVQTDSERARLLALSQLASHNFNPANTNTVQAAPGTKLTDTGGGGGGAEVGAGTGTGTAGGTVASSSVAPMSLSQPIETTGFKKLSHSHNSFGNASGSMISPATSTFSINMAPPSARSVSTGFGMNSPEETMVKKFALDRIEQDEANRHMDVALLTDRNSSLALNEPSMKENSNAKFISQSITLSPTQILSRSADKQQAEPKSSPVSKRKKRSYHRPQDKNKTKGSGSGGPGSGHKNPSFTLDKKNNTIVLGSSLREPETTSKSSTNLPDKKSSF